MSLCDHDGFHSGQGRYDAANERLRYVLTCDACQSEVRELEVLDYRPRFVPDGNGEAVRPAG